MTRRAARSAASLRALPDFEHESSSDSPRSVCENGYDRRRNVSGAVRTLDTVIITRSEAAGQSERSDVVAG